MRYIIGLVAFAALAAGAYYAWNTYGGFAQREPIEEPSPEVVENVRYATSTFSLQYPGNFNLDERYQYTGVPNKPVDGVKFAVPASLVAETNLASDTGVSVEWLPRAVNCTGDIYVLANVRASEFRSASSTYSLATTTKGAAGNMYEEHVYALPESEPCTAVRYLIHTSNFSSVSPEGEESSVREYDRAALLRMFDAIRDSLVLTP